MDSTGTRRASNPPITISSNPEDEDSARAVLQSLVRDRGSKLLPERDYVEMRRTILDELAQGPHLRLPTLLTFGVVGLILFAFMVVGLTMWFRSTPAEWLLAVSSGTGLIAWGWFLSSYVSGIRQQARMSLQERLDEIEDLRRHQLIDQAEYEALYAAILSNRINVGPG